MVDIIKGVAIFLMLWGHCIQYCYPDHKDFHSDTVFEIIYSFHMPLLMLVSGYLFKISSKRYRDEELLPRKVSALIKPIIGGSIFLYSCTILVYSFFKGGFFSALLDGKMLSKLPNLWFLWSVLASTIVMSFVTRFSGKKCAVLCTLVIGFFFVALFPNWYLNVYMYPYFVLGYFYADQKSRIEKFTWLKYISIISFPLLFTLFEKKQYIYTSDIFGKEYSVGEYVRMDVIRWLIGLVGSGFAVTLIQQLSKIRRFRKLGRRIAVLGQKSLQVYVLSVVFLSYYLPILIRNIRRVSVFRDIYTLCSSNPIVYDMVFTLFIAVLYAVVLCWIINILEKLKISKLIFGR